MSSKNGHGEAWRCTGVGTGPCPITVSASSAREESKRGCATRRPNVNDEEPTQDRVAAHGSNRYAKHGSREASDSHFAGRLGREGDPWKGVGDGLSHLLNLALELSYAALLQVRRRGKVVLRSQDCVASKEQDAQVRHDSSPSAKGPFSPLDLAFVPRSPRWGWKLSSDPPTPGSIAPR